MVMQIHYHPAGLSNQSDTTRFQMRFLAAAPTWQLILSLIGNFATHDPNTGDGLQPDENGQVQEAHSISAGLDYPGVGPEHAYFKDTGRAEYVSVTDDEALEGFSLLCRTEGIIPALESSHAVYHAVRVAAELSPEQSLIINLSGRGDKDMHTVAGALGVELT